MKQRVLFLCVHNSARSQMAEALLHTKCADLFEVSSAGLEPGVLNPFAVAVMREIGIDISANKTKGIQELYDVGEKFDFVIAVCDPAVADRCPNFPGSQKLIWSFPDPSAATGSDAARLEAARAVRIQIETAVGWFCEELCSSAIHEG